MFPRLMSATPDTSHIQERHWKNKAESTTAKTLNYTIGNYPIKCFMIGLKKLFMFIFERERMKRGGAEKDRDTEPKGGSRL